MSTLTKLVRLLTRQRPQRSKLKVPPMPNRVSIDRLTATHLRYLLRHVRPSHRALVRQIITNQ